MQQVTFWEELMHVMHTDMMNELTLEQKENLYYTWAVIIPKSPKKQDPSRLVAMLLKGANRQCGKGIIEMAKKESDRLEKPTDMSQELAQTTNPSSSSATGQSPKVKAMRTVKSEILQIVETFVAASALQDEKVSNDNIYVYMFIYLYLFCAVQQIIEKFVPKFLDVVLTDY
ncbi:hypothetical protein RFI_19699 [Reticulomyxa filosa]|uniref:Exportin-1 C-terminal domain-containing protein n=1 Tax=Reticulomyxa filosa TaxID=46433 RepID=X6MVE5_RETFI|nr:hypothetical protein RFI_19699 [Reticulomyxa filosa]|eukprot:ETO17621.1 hypothetical protein RFI_19699 [Reticulomyxa filosa]